MKAKTKAAPEERKAIMTRVPMSVYNKLVAMAEKEERSIDAMARKILTEAASRKRAS